MTDNAPCRPYKPSLLGALSAWWMLKEMARADWAAFLACTIPEDLTERVRAEQRRADPSEPESG